MSPTVWSAWTICIATWFVPVLVLQFLRAHRDRALWEIALDIPFVVAIDLLSILCLTRLVHLEMAALVSRPAWIVVGLIVGIVRWRKGWRPRLPRALGTGDVAAALGAAIMTTAVYRYISFHYDVHDKGLHVPNVTGIASQKIPFINALSGTQKLQYHFGADVLAALLRTLSWDVISSMRALHTAHDLTCALAAATVTLLAIGLGLRRRWSALFGGVAVLLHGPIPLRGAVGHAFEGNSYFNFPNLSYRPHVPLACLLLVGAIGSVVVRAVQRNVRDRSTIPHLLATVAMMSITDEASTAQLGISLGAAWMIDSYLLTRRRWSGAVLLVALAVAVVGTNLAFSASLSPGGPVQRFTLADHARIPAAIHGDNALEWAKPDGFRYFVVEFLPMLVSGTALAMLAIRERTRALLALNVLVWSLIAVCVTLVMRVEVNHHPAESQRYFVAPLVACALVVVLLLDRMPRGSLMAFAGLTGVVVPALYSFYWIHEVGPGELANSKDTEGLQTLDCRKTADAHFGETPLVAYVESSEYYPITACRPVFTSSTDKDWPIPVQPVVVPLEQLRNLDENLVARDEDEVAAICLRDPKATSDAVCQKALRVRTSCRPYGQNYLKCPLLPSDRAALLDSNK